LQEWLLKQWNDIKGNVKFATLGLVGSAAFTLVGLLTHGLTWWQRAILLFIFGVIAFIRVQIRRLTTFPH
jgi:hypothetical protein